MTKSPVESAREYFTNTPSYDLNVWTVIYHVHLLIEYAESLEHEIETLSEHCELLEIDLEELRGRDE